MAAKVGQLVVDFFLNTAKFEKDLKATTRKMKSWGRDLQKVGMSMTKGLTVPIVGAGAAVIKFGADFESAMTKSTAIMGKLSKSMREDMEAAALDVAKTTTFSAKEAADSYFYLASAGLDAAKSITALPKVAEFAQAGMFDMALATDLLTDAQSALGLSVQDAGKNLDNMSRVADVLVKANTLANASVQQFSESLTNKAGAALRVLNKDVEEGVAVLAAFADQGVKGAEAGTQLSIVMRDMQKSALANEGAFREMGIRVYDSQGNMRNLADIIGDMETALDGMSDKQKKATLTMLGFSEKSVSAQLVLLGTSEKIRGYEQALRDAGGTAAEVAANQLTSFTETMKLMGSRVEVAGIKMFKSLKPVLVEHIIPAFDKVISKLESLVDWFSELPQGVQASVIGLLGLTAALGPLLLAFGKFISIFGSAIPLLAKMAIGMKTLALAMGPLGIAFVALAGAVVVYQDEIADAIIATLRFLGIVEELPTKFEGNENAWDRVSGSLRLHRTELAALIEKYNFADGVIKNNRAEIDALIASYDKGAITHDEYKAKLEEIIARTSKLKSETKQHVLVNEELEDAIQKVVDAVNEEIEGVGTLTDELTSLREAFYAEAQPASELAEKLDKLEKAGISTDEILRIYSDDLKEAAVRERELGYVLSDSADRWLDLATKISMTEAETARALSAQEKYAKRQTEINYEISEGYEDLISTTEDYEGSLEDLYKKTSRLDEIWAAEQAKNKEKVEGGWLNLGKTIEDLFGDMKTNFSRNLVDVGDWRNRFVGFFEDTKRKVLAIVEDLVAKLMEKLGGWFLQKLSGALGLGGINIGGGGGGGGGWGGIGINIGIGSIFGGGGLGDIFGGGGIPGSTGPTFPSNSPWYIGGGGNPFELSWPLGWSLEDVMNFTSGGAYGSGISPNSPAWDALADWVWHHGPRPGEFPSSSFPSFDSGIGFVPRDMMAYLHQGERVVPATENRTTNNNRTMTFNITLNGVGLDIVRAVKTKVIPMIKRELESGSSELSESVRFAYDHTARAF
jgi:TP901 family phage tail tape measure protein